MPTRKTASARRPPPSDPTPARRAPRPKGGRPHVTVVPELPVWLQLQRIGGSLTPEQVSAHIRAADIGRMAGLMDLANEARQKDCHLQSVLETRENAVAALPWDLRLPKDPSRKEKKARDLCKDVLKYILPALVPHLNGSIFYGYAVAEDVWMKASGYLVPELVEPIAPRRFVYDGSTLKWWDSSGATPFPGVNPRDWPGQFIISQPRVNGDVRCREGLVRPLMWAALFRNWTLADWMKLAEIAWKPWRTGSYKPGTKQADIDVLTAILQAMTANGIAVYPETTNLKVEWPGAGSGALSASSHGALFPVLAAEMSKAVLGQTETTEASKSSGYAQAKVHNLVRKDKRDGDAQFIAADITRDLLAWIVLWNFGEEVRPSELYFVTEDTVDFATFSTSTKAFKEAGLRMPAKWVRSTAGIPDPAEGDELVGDLEVAGEGDGSEEETPKVTPDEKPEEKPAEPAA